MWYVYGALVAICVLGVISIKQGWIGYMPPLDELNDPIDKYASQVFSADGKMLGTWSQKENRIAWLYGATQCRRRLYNHAAAC